jgi:hypothetical protein
MNVELNVLKAISAVNWFPEILTCCRTGAMSDFGYHRGQKVVMAIRLHAAAAT